MTRSIEVIAHIYVVVMQRNGENTSTNVAGWETRVDADRQVQALHAQNPRIAAWVDTLPIYGPARRAPGSLAPNLVKP